MKYTPCLITVGLLAAATSVPAWAADAEAPKPKPVDTIAQTPLSAAWAARIWLQDRGVTPSARIVVATGVNSDGYKGTGWSTAEHVDIGAMIDTGKAFGVDGTMRVVFSDRFGNAVNDRSTGSYVQNQAFYGQGQNLRFNELSYERWLLDKRLSLKGGFYSMGNDFGGLPYTCNFNNNGQCGHPLGPIYSSGWLDNPTGQWGLRVKWADPSGWYAQTGIYDVVPMRKQAGSGFRVSDRGKTGLFLPVEVGYSHGNTGAHYGGTYKVGYYLDTSNADDIGNPAAPRASHRSGSYIQLAQRVLKPEGDTVRGVSVFGVATRADAKTGLMRYSWEAGLSWRGVVASREDDVLSLAWTRLDISDRLAEYQRITGKDVQSNEQFVELNYGVQVTPWLILRPAVQYVARPGAYDSRPDSWVFTLQAQATL
ncbi:carbohydrate porin [Stenotrophomonas sp. RG-453]|uniref:carbohydrate porin n=1 Tax=Stenotrophomonas sp. RG-453 TaxID=2957502 RepID=UPI0029CA1E38|nr:carbohydrate porin [Stenotrophomonas sp. RG-453]MDX5517391.1 carbohydrate porin [Stenotrophomonas sp. RG-453]